MMIARYPIAAPTTWRAAVLSTLLATAVFVFNTNAQTGSKDTLPDFPADAPVYRIKPTRGFPYALTDIHNYALPQDEFKRRRAAFLEELRKLGPGTVAIFKSAPVQPRNGDVDHEYRQDSDFYYMTGWPESDALAVFDVDAMEAADDPGKVKNENTAERGVYSLVVLPRDPAQETWTGKRIGPDRAKSEFGADAAFVTSKRDEIVKNAVSRAKTLVIVNRFDRDFDALIEKTLADVRARKGESPKIVNMKKWIGEQRLMKSPAEIDAMKRAVEVTIEGQLAAMRASRPGMNEGEIEAAAEFAFRAIGGPRLGYPSIAGAGNNGCVLHYNTNNEITGPDSLMLLDAATEVGYYTADITRTWPVNGKFTKEQRIIYDIVLKAQNAGIDQCRVGVAFGEVHRAAVREVTKGLLEHGLLKGELEELIKTSAHRKYFMHGTSHWLGLDVHDTGDTQGNKRKFEPGMILTVEPGIYIAEGSPDADKKWWGIGVRIEDDILITGDGPVNLSARLPRDPDLIEKIVQGGLK